MGNILYSRDDGLKAFDILVRADQYYKVFVNLPPDSFFDLYFDVNRLLEVCSLNF